MFISTQDLEKIYQDNSVLILDARSYNDYSKAHIPGAVSLDLFSFLEAQMPKGIPISEQIISDAKTIYTVIIALTQYPEEAIKKTNNITVIEIFHFPNFHPIAPASNMTPVQGIDWNIAFNGIKK